MNTYYNKSEIIIIMYSIDDRNSFEMVDVYYQKCKNTNKTNSVIVIVGNKSDSKNRVVFRNEGNNYAISKNIAFFEISVKENKGLINVIVYSINQLNSNNK